MNYRFGGDREAWSYRLATAGSLGRTETGPQHLPRRTVPDVCVIVPTRNESANVEPLVDRLTGGLAHLAAQVIFVDDSTDDTPEQVRAVAATATMPVRLIHRDPGERSGGLGSAVLAGLSAAVEAGATWAVVMDGDLQHPPEVVADLVREGVAAEADLVVASRYLDGASSDGLADSARIAVSAGATRLTKLAFPRRMSGCTDPMSGFFAVRLSSLELNRLQPRGFKILLEIVARSPRLRIAEVPFSFAPRNSGQSKATWREGLLFVRRLAGLRVAGRAGGRLGSRLAALSGFAAVGATGIVVNTLALWVMVTVVGAPLLLAATTATQLSTGWNFVLTDTLVFRGPKSRPFWLRLGGFVLINNLVLLLRLPLLSWLSYHAGLHYLTANALTLLAAFAVRYLISDLFLFATGRTMSTINRTYENPISDTPQEPGSDPVAGRDPAPSRIVRNGPTDLVVDLRPAGPPPVRVTRGKLQWRYDIHGLVTIGSVSRLSELDCFAAPDAAGPFDIEIRGGYLDRPRARARARVTQYAAPAVSYEEHTARLGTDFMIEMSPRITVTVGPMLVASPHVLYTNVVEALLRFVLVARGRVLLHSACLDLDGQGVMLSARTDTGKTGTVLRLLRERGGGFLSDDMTILSADGIAWSFPKPMTISQHTLRAVDAGDLTRAEWRRLRLQSRLHSKQGRGIGCRMGEWNVPIMCLNALTQFIVPPPKYGVERLVPCRQQAAVAVAELFIIERGRAGIEAISPDALIDELIDNTDDAYQFPPFRYFAPALVIDGADYEQLRAAERRILTQAMQRVRARRLVSSDFDWADRIPALTDC
ncbi:MAG TPA: glycosyltransferase [Flexivirga sp.]|uniref:glycosyltransferase n=1 Tax=Flexivirga sp. TaxID=1962927 RepID=UPI002BC6568C|nr:glycosyltransferase [Flexivirga sp.]HWC24013.1 glycosyltransferase [Flexivirga sp.]